MSKKKLAIVGGGYIGVELAKALQADMDVTLIEPRSAFIHAPAMIRALVDTSLLEKALIPYDQLGGSINFVQDRATLVTADGVELAVGAKVDADYIVVATGSSNGAVFKPASDDLDALRAKNAEVHSKLKAATSLAIVGAGAVGTELAGEVAAAMPDKKVTLISADPSLFPGMPAKLGSSLASKLANMGVELVLGARVENLQSLTDPYAGSLMLSNGQKMEADLVIPAIGSKPQVDLLKPLPDATEGIAGRIKVDSYLRPSSLPNVFAAGDSVDCGDGMTIVAASRQQPWLAKTLKALASGKTLSTQKSYTPWGKAPILIPLGPKRGSSFLGFATVGDWLTSQVKGKDLFIGRYRKILGIG